jgi:hypothetical protein
MEIFRFNDSIKIVNGNPYVTPPKNILEKIFSQAGKYKGPIPISGKLNGAAYRQTLVKYIGAWRLYVNGLMLKAAGIKFIDGEIYKVVGTKVVIEVRYDSQSRILPMHAKLVGALSHDATAKKAYEVLAPYRKHEINRYLGFLKNEKSIDKNISRIIKHLKGEKVDALYALMHKKE